MAETKKNFLKLIRFSGEENFPITKATWFVHKDEQGDELWLYIETAMTTLVCEDTKGEKEKPHWELSFIAGKLNKEDLKTGFKAEIPNGYCEEREDYITNFYFYEHQETDNNTIEVLDRDGDRLYIRLTGETMDVNYYDGSKPENKIIAEAWFECR